MNIITCIFYVAVLVAATFLCVMLNDLYDKIHETYLTLKGNIYIKLESMNNSLWRIESRLTTMQSTIDNIARSEDSDVTNEQERE